MNPSKLFTAGYWTRLWEDHADGIGQALLSVLVVLVGYWVLRLIVFKLIDRVVESPLAQGGDESRPARQARMRALQSALKSISGFVLGFVAAIMILQAAGINVVPLLTTASVAGLAIGFGAQKLVRDVISGFFILMEDQYGVGEQVTIGAVTGTVEELGMRTTRIRDAAGKLCIIANGDIAQVCNHSRGPIRISQDIVVPASVDLEKAVRVLNDVGRNLASEMPDGIHEPFAVQGLVQVSGASAAIRLAGAVGAAFQDHVLLELNSRVREAFEKNGLPLA